MNVVDIINKAISERRTRFAFELLPPLKGDGCCGVFGSIDRLIGFGKAYITVTFHREGIKQAVRPDGSVEWHVVRRRPGTVGISAAIQKKYDVEVVPHLICGGQSKYDIEDALIDLDFLGLHNVLALRGDKSQNEKFFMPHPQGHTHAVDLVRQIAAMNRGQFVDGEVEECHHSKFSIGVAGYPEVHFEARDVTSDIRHLREKIDAVEEYVITQMFFDNDIHYNFLYRIREAGITVPVLPGIMPITSAAQMKRSQELSGTVFPRRFLAILDRFGSSPDAMKQAGIAYATDQIIDLLANGVNNIHIYSMNKPEIAVAIMNNLSEIIKC